MGNIILTGTPGTGKTVIARALAKKLGFELIDIKKIVEKNRLKEKDQKVDLKRLKIAMCKKLYARGWKRGASSLLLKAYGTIIEGHLACELRLPAKFVFVLRCEPAILKKRLIKRKYAKKKTEENVLAEMLDYCTILARKNYKKSKIIELDTTKRNINKCVAEIINVIRGKKNKIDNVDYNKELKQWALSHGQ